MNTAAETHEESIPAQTAHDFIRRAATIEESIRTLFGGHSPQLREFRSIAARHRDEWDALASNRGLTLPALAFIGERGAGKSTLIRLLTDAAPRNTPANADRIQWIGPQKPATLHADTEEYLRVNATDMADLGRPYLLIDTPGFNPATPQNDNRFHRLFTTTRLKVVVVQWEKIESNHWQQMVAAYRGSVILPVIRLDPESTTNYPDNITTLQQTWQHDYLPDIQAHLPGIEIESPVFLPHLDAMGDRETSLPAVKQALTLRLRAFLDARQATSADRLAELETSWNRFRQALRPITTTFDTPLLTERYRELEQAIAKLPEHIIDHLLADERRIRALIRMDLRSNLIDRVPASAFPFRTLCGLLCLTTGLWDRLILGAAGSLPSTFLTVAGAARNRSEEIRAEKSHRHGMHTAIHTLVRNRLSAPWNGFAAALAKAGEAPPEATETHHSDFQIEGEDQLADLWKNAQADAVRPEAAKGTAFIPLLSILGTLTFWVLFAGPLIQTYGQYLPASIRSITGSWTPENLTSYPAPGGGFWFTAIILSLIPPFLIALILVAIRLGNRRITRCVNRLNTLMHDHLHQGDLTLRIHPTDPRAKAYRQLTSPP